MKSHTHNPSILPLHCEMNIIKQLWDPSKCNSPIENSIFTNYALEYGVGVRIFNLEFQNKGEIKAR